jgi:hypothetical protein
LLTDNFSNDNDSSDLNIDPHLCKAPPCVLKTPATTVSEPKHTPLSGFCKQVNSLLSGLGELMKIKVAAEEKK